MACSVSFARCHITARGSRERKSRLNEETCARFCVTRSQVDVDAPTLQRKAVTKPVRMRTSRTSRYEVRASAGAGAQEGGMALDVITQRDVELLMLAADGSLAFSGETGPHPNACCVIADASGKVLGSAAQRAHGTTACEVLAIAAVPEGAARGGTAYLNLESGDCVGERAAIDALVASGVRRVVVGLKHPLLHWRGCSIAALRAAGVTVAVLGESRCEADPASSAAAYDTCLRANEALLVRGHSGRPLSLLKYAMTLDGKIATHAGHAAWVSCAESRAKVFEQRSWSDAVIVGGNTVRRDNPRLTTRREGGHTPARVVLTRTLDLPEDANLWDTALAPTIVMTQRGARRDFQDRLRRKGVEVIEFDFLDPKTIVEYLHDRGYLRLFWECGGRLSAPAIQAGVIDKVMVFVAPKIIGGVHAPTPVGDLGFVEMTQAVGITHAQWEASGSDMMLTGYLSSTVPSLAALDEALDSMLAVREARAEKGGHASTSGGDPVQPPRRGGKATPGSRAVADFYKACDEWGALSNFSPHPISLPGLSGGQPRQWACVEHYYQAMKFWGVPGAEATVESIAAAPSPEEAARIGRRTQRLSPELVRKGWDDEKVDVMRGALRAKFLAHKGPRELLLSTASGAPGGGALFLAEGSPHDTFWGRGRDGTGRNQLGALLMELRDELLADAGRGEELAELVGACDGS